MQTTDSGSTQLTFAALLTQTTWPEVKAALLWLYPDTLGSLQEYRKVFRLLGEITPADSDMRICIRTPIRMADESPPDVEVVGKNGTLNRDQEDFQHSRYARDSAHALGETLFSLSLTPWDEWLGMRIDNDALKTLTTAHLVAHCLWELTFHGFAPDDGQIVLDDLRESLAAIKAMTDEERKTKLIPYDDAAGVPREDRDSPDV